MFNYYKLFSTNKVTTPVVTPTVVIDAISNVFPASSTTWTLAHTCTGINRFLQVSIEVLNATERITGVTYNGTSMTQAIKIQNPHTAGWLYIYTLVNPTSGANNIVASFSLAVVGSMGGLSYTGAKQSAQPNSTVSNTATNSLTFSLTMTVASQCWLSGFAVDNSGFSTAGANTTLRVGFTSGSGQKLFDSNGPQTPSGSYSLNLANVTATTDWVGLAIAISPL